MNTLDQISKEYKDTAMDPSQPFFREVFNLHQEFPNDMEFGNKVRKLIEKVNDHLRAKAMKESEAQLKIIFQNEGIS